MPAKTKRQINEPGHERKFLVVVDDSPEFEAAMNFAARMAGRMGGALAMLYVNEPLKTSGWFAIQVDTPDEPAKRAKREIERFRGKLDGMGLKKLNTEAIIRNGDQADEIIKVIERDKDIAVLVLGASASPEGPGPLVSSLAAGSRAGTFPIPIIIVPGDLTAGEVAALA